MRESFKPTDNDSPAKRGHFIRIAREQRSTLDNKITQQVLAEMLKAVADPRVERPVSRSMLGKIENGTVIARRSTIALIEKALQLEPGELSNVYYNDQTERVAIRKDSGRVSRLSPREPYPVCATNVSPNSAWTSGGATVQVKINPVLAGLPAKYFQLSGTVGNIRRGNVMVFLDSSFEPDDVYLLFTNEAGEELIGYKSSANLGKIMVGNAEPVPEGEWNCVGYCCAVAWGPEDRMMNHVVLDAGIGVRAPIPN